MMKKVLLLMLMFWPICLGCGGAPVAEPTPVENEAQSLETAVQEISLAGPITDRNAELSGLAWYGDHLILLPQFPDFSRGTPAIYAIPKTQILAILDGNNNQAIEPIAIPFENNGLGDSIRGFEGYEAIGFLGDTAYVTIEASGGGMKGFLAQGQIEPDLSQFTIVNPRMTQIEQPVMLGNRSDEALLIVDETVVTFYESNGAAVNEAPIAHLFGPDLSIAGTVSFPHIPFRITDVTELDENGRFWAINYNFPNDRAIQEEDSLIAEYEEGPTHLNSEGVERLVEFQYSEEGITRLDQPPIQLQLLDEDLRNWEGIVRLDDRGFLLVTDKFPETILAFVPLGE
ncbi:MAG: hypothetical protein AAF490_13065 [Chloroflexota bacterium]